MVSRFNRAALASIAVDVNGAVREVELEAVVARDATEAGRTSARAFGRPDGRSSCEIGRPEGASAFIARERPGAAMERTGATAILGLSGARDAAVAGTRGRAEVEAFAAGADTGEPLAALISGIIVAFEAGLSLEV